MPLITLCSNTFRRTDAFIGLIGAKENGLAVYVVTWQTATTITQVNINFHEKNYIRSNNIEIYSNRNDNFDTKHKYNILFSGGVHSSRPWDKEWTAGEVVTCTGILPMLTLYQYGYA